MGRGIIVFGASGSGTTSVGAELSRILGFSHFDIDDFFWNWDTEVPFTTPNTKEDRIEKLLNAVNSCTGFVLSGSICGWDEPFIPLFDLAVFVKTDTSTRIERLRKRELSEYGDRILPGGDMYEYHNSFLIWASQYDDILHPPERCLALHEQWATTLPCPVIGIDGADEIEANATRVMEQYSPMLPPDLQAILNGYSCSKNRIGCSSAGVYRYQSDIDSFYLKIARADSDIRREYRLLAWMNGKLPVPQIRYWHEHDGLAYLLMSELPGKMCCDCPDVSVAEPVENTVKLLAQGLLMLQSVDTADCPSDNTLENHLERALCNIQNNRVDMDDWENNNRFKTPMELYQWLKENKPVEEVTFTHGDYCLPNVFIDDTTVIGFIDVDRGGLADKWQDIALCVRSLGYNLGDMGKAEKDHYIHLLFSYLDIEPNWEKINYYILLDELF